MSHKLWGGIAIIAMSAGFALGWLVERHVGRQGTVAGSSAPAADDSQQDVDCLQASDAYWGHVQVFDYAPVHTTYIVLVEYCAGDPISRVRVMAADFKTVLFHYEDAQVLHVEQVDLSSDHIPELFVMTGSSGTNDSTPWHVIGESNGKLHEWSSPDYDAATAKLLGEDEDLCCKEWNFHLKGSDVFLARGIYHKGDPNCCPTRGGALIHLKPVQDRFDLASAERISKKEYDLWAHAPFCDQCVLR